MGDFRHLAFDASTRSIDRDGRLHVSVANISKAMVNPYLGSEIPDYQSLGLDPNKIYNLYRDPQELAKAAPTFNNIPLLSRHVPVSADKPEHALVMGSTGTDAAFNAPYLQNSLVVWDAGAIAGIESGAQKQLSCAYRYVADMTPGVDAGLQYDGVMRAIVGNHVALVEAGRAGRDVVVGDSKMKEVIVAQRPLKPRKTQWAHDADTGAIAAQVKDLLDSLDTTDLSQDDDDSDGGMDDADPLAFLVGKLSDEDMAKLRALIAPANPPAAMDAAIKAAEAAAARRMNAIREAERAVRPYVGELSVALDSGEAIYRFALESLGVDVTGVHPSALAAILKLHPLPGAAATPRVAMDSAARSDFAKRFPAADRLKQI